MHIVLPVKFDEFGGVYALIYIPVAYLVVTYMFIHDLEKNNHLKKRYLIPVLIGYTLLNFILGMPLLYNIAIIVFLILLKGSLVEDTEETLKNIKEYYENKNSK